MQAEDEASGGHLVKESRCPIAEREHMDPPPIAIKR
jgi:hypothetical protein